MKILFIIFLLSIGSVMLWIPGRNQPQQFELAGKVFNVPEYLKNWGVGSIVNTTQNLTYPQFRITFSEQELHDVEYYAAEDASHLRKSMPIYVEVRPIRTEWGESRYWTKDDPVKTADKLNCKKRSIGNHTYEICQLSSEMPLVSGMDDYYLIQQNSDDYLAVIGCQTKKAANVNFVCVGHTHFGGELQMEYQFMTKILGHIDQYVNVTHNLRSLIKGMIRN